MNSEIIKNFFWRGLQTFGKQGLFFLVFIIGARLLSQELFGTYNYIISSVMILTLFCDFGISTATSRHISMSRELNNESPEEVVFNMSLLVISISTLIFLFLVCFGGYFFKDNFKYALYAILLIFLIPLTSIQEGLYIGLEKFKKLSLIIIISGIINILFSYILILKYGLGGAVLAQTTFYLIELILLILFHGKLRSKFKKSIIYSIGKYSVYIGIAGLGYFLFSRIDIVILGYYGYTKEIANYEIINKLISFITAPAVVFSSVIFPKIALMFAKKESEKIWIFYKKVLLINVLVSMFLISICFFGFNFFVKTLFPTYNALELKAIFSIISVLIFSQMITIIISGGFSISTGNAKLNMKFLLIFGILLIPIVLLSVHYYGFKGVLYGTVGVKLLSDIFYIYYYTKTIRWKK